MNNDNITLDENLVSSKREVANLSDSDIFKKIWTKPRMVMEFIDKNEYDKWLFPILIILGINTTLGNFIDNDFGGIFTNPAVSITFGLIIGALLGWISYYIFAAILKISGSWLGGEATTYELLRTTTYAVIPTLITAILSLAFQVLSLMEWGEFLANYTQLIVFIAAVFVIIAIVLFIWSIVNIIVGISVTQNFSIGRSIANFFLAIMMILIPIAFFIYYLVWTKVQYL
ncbi:Yip1 family protein [Mangrovivirga sp. M17]|uniref:Yip1 family protein n=1 Tax=Mangrovivirga halotolerans TaxID=2993936 RepID=A0ABT3RQ03_9BACT|nr:Yip1 family protein [Mangrovivirga halotolerans]MCX2743245.1 Yip1 family protein [Mangrovivirga halotolerans]